MNKLLLLITSFFCFSLISAQQEFGGLPYSLGKGNIPKVNTTFKLHPIDNDQLLAEDEILASQGDKTFRFGKDVLVDISPEDHGEWRTLANDTRIWRLKIKSSGAKSLNFIFDRFNLPVGAKLFIFSEDGSLVKGAFTDANENKLNNFATLPIKGEELIIEYVQPKFVSGTLDLHISYIIHGYRDFNSALKGFEDSGSCNNNVICPEGDDWDAQKRANVMLLTSNNSRFCSGAAINNTANDGTPYVLSANHCDVGATDIFMFNYFSPTCTPNNDGNTSDVVIGCTPRANRQNSDFALVELSEEIPAEYNAYLAGWSRQDNSPQNTTGIHHPRGDVMKISFNIDDTQVGTYNGADCWHVLDWEDGTTEPGSSGSPLFNENKLIIGQLYGGTANCNNNVDDYYGRFITSWSGPSSNRRLNDWLDPGNLDPQTLEGREASMPTLALDLNLQSIISPLETVCGASSIVPEIVVKNNGIETVTGFTVVYGLGAIQNLEYQWTGTLVSNASINVTLPAINNFNIGDSQQFTANITLANGGADNNLSNNILEKSTDIGEGKNYRLELVSDNYPEENSFTLRNNLTNEIIDQVVEGDLQEGTTNRSYCLPTGCYTFTIEDSYGDGICCSFFNGFGSYTIYDNTGAEIASGGEFNFSESFDFCVDTVVSVAGIFQKEDFQVYPNPTDNFLTMEYSGTAIEYHISLFDIGGKEIYRESSDQVKLILPTQQLENGMYLLKVQSDAEVFTKQVIIAH